MRISYLIQNIISMYWNFKSSRYLSIPWIVGCGNRSRKKSLSLSYLLSSRMFVSVSVRVNSRYSMCSRWNRKCNMVFIRNSEMDKHFRLSEIIFNSKWLCYNSSRIWRTYESKFVIRNYLLKLICISIVVLFLHILTYFGIKN